MSSPWPRILLARRGLRENTRKRKKERLLDEIWELKATASALNKAEAANEAKSRFLAMVSHEIRTPLTGILGMAELLTATELSAEQTSYVDAIRVSGESLSSLINEILDFSKIEAGKLDLNRAVFDVHALVEGIAELLAPRAQGKGIEIATSIDCHVSPRVLGDSERLRQVLINLAGNAVKFTESGGVGIAVKQAPGGKVSFSVCDTGPGVPDDRRQAIFEEFEQVDGSMTRRHEGTGLGLAISKLLVELMGGDLRLERSGPDGSIFSFSIALPSAAPSGRGPGDPGPGGIERQKRSDCRELPLRRGILGASVWPNWASRCFASRTRPPRSRSCAKRRLRWRLSIAPWASRRPIA